MNATQPGTDMGVATARRLAEIARETGFGACPDIATQRAQEALKLLADEAPTPLLADTLRWQGTVLRDRGRTSEAEPLYRRSLEASIGLGYDAGIAQAMNCLAGLAQRRGDLCTTFTLLTDAFAIADRCGERSLMAMIQTNLGVIADIRGNQVAALAHYDVALRMSEAAKDEQQMTRVLINLGTLHAKHGRCDAAERAYTRGLAISRARGDLFYEGLFEENRAELWLTMGELDEAYPSIRRALDIAEQRRDDLRRAAALKLRGAYERLSGRAAEATETLRHGLTLAAVTEDALLGAEILYQFGLALYDGRDAQMAREVWTVALDAFERIAAREWVGRVRQRLAMGATDRYQ